jgi:uncharacterized membrane protein
MVFKKFGSGTLIAIAITSMLLIVTTAGVLTTTQTLPSSGSISAVSAVGVSLYSDAGLTTPMSSITWGTLNPGGQVSTTVYIKNTGNIPETLSMATTGWTPSNANTYLTCTWNPTATNIAAGASTSATITLAVSGSATITSFSFSIIITGTQ